MLNSMTEVTITDIQLTNVFFLKLNSMPYHSGRGGAIARTFFFDLELVLVLVIKLTKSYSFVNM